MADLPGGEQEIDQATVRFNEKFHERIAVFVAGDTPAVITETLCLLLRGEDCQSHLDDGAPHRFQPTRVVVITTSSAGDRGAQTNGCQQAYRAKHTGEILDCLAEYGIDKVSIELHFMTRVRPTTAPTVVIDTATGVHDKSLALGTKKGRPSNWTSLRVCEYGPDVSDPAFLGDVRSNEETSAAGNYITDVIVALTKGESNVIHASLAGGRKSMSSFMQGAMWLFGRRQDRLSHVTVHDDLEDRYVAWSDQPVLPHNSHSDRTGAFLLSGDQNLLRTGGSPEKAIWLSDIPFVRLRSFEGVDANPDYSFVELVRKAQDRLEPPKLTVNFTTGTIDINGSALQAPSGREFQPSDKAFLAWCAIHRVASRPLIVEPEENDSFLEVTTQWWRAFSVCLGKMGGTASSPSKRTFERLKSNSNHAARLVSANLELIGRSPGRRRKVQFSLSDAVQEVSIVGLSDLDMQAMLVAEQD